MRHEVTVRFATGDESVLYPAQAKPLDEARAWLDGEFLRLDCEPVRASGKVLFADKLLAIADAAGTGGFADAAWAEAYGSAALGALGRSPVRVDLTTLSLGP